MENRRDFLKLAVIGLGTVAVGFLVRTRRIWAMAKKVVLPENANALDMERSNPADFDVSQVNNTPVEEFGVMGQSEYDVDLETWRLEITGLVEKPLSLTYDEILALPASTKKVLLVCPGVFSYVAEWKGFPLKHLLAQNGLKPEAMKIKAYGPEGQRYRKEETFSREEVDAEKVFLAYAVNGRPLPEKHGFPLRIVAEDRYGDDWVKFLSKIEVV